MKLDSYLIITAETINQIVHQIKSDTESLIKQLFFLKRNYNQYMNYVNDIIQEFWVWFLTYDQEKIIKMYKNKELSFFIAGIVNQNLNGNSGFLKNFKVEEIKASITEFNVNTKDYEFFKSDIYQDIHNLEQSIINDIKSLLLKKEAENPIFIRERVLYNLKMQNMNIVSIAKQTKMSKYSIQKYLSSATKLINSDQNIKDQYKKLKELYFQCERLNQRKAVVEYELNLF